MPKKNPYEDSKEKTYLPVTRYGITVFQILLRCIQTSLKQKNRKQLQ